MGNDLNVREEKTDHIDKNKERTVKYFVILFLLDVRMKSALPS
jgi:hypothetical protein